jgi:hypothetical protein
VQNQQGLSWDLESSYKCLISTIIKISMILGLSVQVFWREMCALKIFRLLGGKGQFQGHM